LSDYNNQAREMKCIVYLWALGISVLAFTSATALEGNFTYEGVANCRQPKLTNHAIRGSGTASLQQDRSAGVNYRDSVGGGGRYQGKLGGPAVEARDGSIKVNVKNRNTLRVVRDFQNNTVLVDIKFVGRTCSITMTDHLKAGKTEHTYPTYLGLAYCERLKLTKTTCVVRD
jgi:hypothetical protein